MTTRNSYRLSFDTLEARDVPAYINMASGGIVQIVGDNGWHDNAHSWKSGNQIIVRIQSTPTSGFLLTPNVIEQRFNASSVREIRFWGYSGDDRFVNDALIRTMAWGGDGNDYLEGANATDQFFGGEGNDTLVGYGGSDYLNGENGNDYLQGGSGRDFLDGGWGKDRYSDDWTLFIGGASISDVKQGESGVCTILGAIADTMVTNFGGRGAWMNRIRYVSPGTYDVYLYGQATLSGGSGYWQRTTFDGTWDDDDARPNLVNGVNEVWTLIANRAVLDSYGVPWRSYWSESNQWGTWWMRCNIALERVTGYSAGTQQTISVFGVANPADLQRRLTNYFVTAGSRPSTGNNLIVESHCYAVCSCYSQNGNWYVRLYNPWGVDGRSSVDGANDGFVTVNWGTFVASFWGYYYS